VLLGCFGGGTMPLLFGCAAESLQNQQVEANKHKNPRGSLRIASFGLD